MPSTVPTPVAAALGLVPTVLGGVRRLPSRAVQLPVLALSSALSGAVAARREYDDLAERGERLIARLRGISFDEVEDAVEDALGGTPLARPYDAVEDALEDAVEGVTAAVTSTVQRGARAAGKGLDQAADVVEDAAETVAKGAQNGVAGATEAANAVADAAAPTDAPAKPGAKNKPTPKATEPDMTRIDTAATPDVTQTVERVADSVGHTVLSHDELPLPDYDHMTLGSLRGRMRSLTVEQLVQVRDYEKAHADRLPVVTMLDNRIAKLATEAGAAQPTGTPPTSPTPEQLTAAGGTGSKVSPETGGPALNPPSQGVPTNPAQPR